MMESSGSEKSQTRYSTPVPELDDHRSQSIPILSVNTADARAPHGESITGLRAVSSPQEQSPMLLRVDDRLRLVQPVSRDFEHAIIDDSSSRLDDVHKEDENVIPPPSASRRRPSTRPTDNADAVSKTRDRSESSRSTSPPNSIDAFAGGRRRERANTFGSRSRKDSELEIGLQRTASNGTHRRRPTFDNASIRPAEVLDDVAGHVDDFSEHVDPVKTFVTVDYEEIEEFVAECNHGRPPHAPRQKFSYASQGYSPSKTNTLGPVGGGSIPKIVTKPYGPFKSDGTELSEKQDLSGYTSDCGREEQYRFSFFASEIERTIHTPEIGDLVDSDNTFRDLFEIPPEGGAWWLDVQSPTEEELEMFQKAFGIHKLTAEDIQSQEPREKVELFQKYYFVCFRSFYQMDPSSEKFLVPVNVYMVVFRDGIITFSYDSTPHAEGVRKRIGKNRNYIDLTADWICYAMVDNIVDSFGPVIRTIERETDQIEDQVFTARHADFSELLQQIGECRKRVMSIMRLLGGKADVIKGFAKRCNEQYSVTPRGEIGLYLGDIQDHVVTMMSSLGHFEKMLSRSHANYLAQLSVDQIGQGNRANEVLGKITLIATVLVPLNLVCGLFGMNVNVPGKNTEGLAWFWGIIGFLALCVATSLIAAKRMRFI